MGGYLLNLRPAPAHGRAARRAMARLDGCPMKTRGAARQPHAARLYQDPPVVGAGVVPATLSIADITRIA